MYGKIFSQMYSSSISSNWKALVTFQQMIVLSDKNGVVDMTIDAISRHTGIPIEIIGEGIAELEKPDASSRSRDHEGRRIVRLDDHRDWGWFIVNYKRYREIRDEDQRREDARLRMERLRAKRCQEDVRIGSQPVRNVRTGSPEFAHGEGEGEGEREGRDKYSLLPEGKSISENDRPPSAKATRFQKPTVEEIRAYIAEKELTIDAQAFFDFYEAKGWVIGKAPMRSWKHAIATWEHRRPKPPEEVAAEQKAKAEAFQRRWGAVAGTVKDYARAVAARIGRPPVDGTVGLYFAEAARINTAAEEACRGAHTDGVIVDALCARVDTGEFFEPSLFGEGEFLAPEEPALRRM